MASLALRERPDVKLVDLVCLGRGEFWGLSVPKCLFRHYSLLVAIVLEHRLATPGEVAEPSLAPFHVYLVADWLSKASSFPGLQLADLTVLQPTQQIPNSKWVASLLPSCGLVSAAVWLKDLRASQLQPSFACCLTVLTDLLPWTVS